MAIKLFGFQFGREEPSYLKNDKIRNDPISFVNSDAEATTVDIYVSPYASGAILDLSGNLKTESDFINKYREMASHPEVKNAVSEIVNEAISTDEEFVVKIDLDNVEAIDEPAKMVIKEQFDEILRLLDFKNLAYEIFNRWYIDGRLYYHAVIDFKNPTDGIKELRYIDPRKIREIKEIQNAKLRISGDNNSVNQTVEVKNTKNNYYLYNETGFGRVDISNPGNSQQFSGIKISKDSIIHIPSGETDVTGKIGLSFLHMAMKSLTELRTIEDAVIIYRLARAPERRVWQVDVGNMPPKKAEEHLKKVADLQKNRLIYDSTTGAIKDDRKFQCFALDTLIPLLDGRTLTLENLIEEYNHGIKNWVYSCDPITGKFSPGPISWAGITKRNSNVVKVTFDNGKSVICTPDHKFPVWNEGLIEAQHLSIYDSIIPGYRREKEITTNGIKYEQIYKNDTKTWEFTHREVAKWKNQNNLRDEFTYFDKYNLNKKTIIHHKDFKNRNNNPENLIMMNYKDHMEYHKFISRIDYTNEIVSKVEESAKNQSSLEEAIKYINDNINVEEWIENNKNKHVRNRNIKNLTFSYKDLNKISKSFEYKDYRSFRKQYDTTIRTPSGAKKRGETFRFSPEWRQKQSISKKGKISHCKTWKIITPTNETLIIENLNEFCRFNNLNRNNIKLYGSKGYKAELLHNHKIVSVEFLNNKIDVGCITVDLEETYHSNHTYLLDAGVYTKNTITEDLWLPKRADGVGTSVDVLKAGENLGNIEDIIYFQKRLFNALNVPIDRLQSDTPFAGNTQEISRAEVKFDKFVTRLRQRFQLLFTKCLERHVVLKGLMSIEEFKLIEKDIQYEFARDNHFAELIDQQVWSSRLQTYQGFMQTQLIGTYFSNKWIRRYIFKQTEEDIAKMNEEILEEQNDPLYAPPDQGLNPDDTNDDNTDINDTNVTTHGSQSSSYHEKQQKVDNARHIVNSLAGTENKNAEQQKQYRSAVQILARNT